MECVIYRIIFGDALTRNCKLSNLLEVRNIFMNKRFLSEQHKCASTAGQSSVANSLPLALNIMCLKKKRLIKDIDTVFYQLIAVATITFT